MGHCHRSNDLSPQVSGSILVVSSGRSNMKSGLSYRHIDVFHRGFEGNSPDQARYLDPINGRLRKVKVQTVFPQIRKQDNISWAQIKGVKNISPRILRLAYWPFSVVPEVDASRLGKPSPIKKFRAARRAWDTRDWAIIGLCWLPACVGLSVLVRRSAMELRSPVDSTLRCCYQRA